MQPESETCGKKKKKGGERVYRRLRITTRLSREQQGLRQKRLAEQKNKKKKKKREREACHRDPKMSLPPYTDSSSHSFFT